MYQSKTILGILGTAIASLSSVLPAQAYSIYFGQDANPNPTDFANTFDDIVNSRAAEAAFLSAITGEGTEDFEGFTAFSDAPLDIFFDGVATATLSGGGVSSEVKTVDTSLLDDPGTPDSVKADIRREIEKGRNASSGTQYWLTNGAQDFQVNFDQKVASFGFYGYDLGDYDAETYLDLYRDGELISSLLIPNGETAGINGSAFYFGFVGNGNETFDQVNFRMNGVTGDEFAFDDMTVGSQPIPEPASLLGLLGVTAAGATFLKRRDASKSEL
jgi:hypothetical protein